MQVTDKHYIRLQDYKAFVIAMQNQYQQMLAKAAVPEVKLTKYKRNFWADEEDKVEVIDKRSDFEKLLPARIIILKHEYNRICYYESIGERAILVDGENASMFFAWWHGVELLNVVLH